MSYLSVIIETMPIVLLNKHVCKKKLKNMYIVCVYHIKHTIYGHMKYFFTYSTSILSGKHA